MQIMKPVVLAFSLFAFACAPAFAAGDAKSGATSKNTSPSSAAGGSSASTSNDEFSRLDKNHDGKISRQEWKDAHKSSAAGGSSKKSTQK